MNKGELVEKIMKENEGDILTKAAAERIVNSFIQTIMDEVVNGGEVAIVGFGTFKSANKKETTGRNPQTGETMVIPAKKVPKFVAGKTFKDAVNR